MATVMSRSSKLIPDYRTIWRWHFYAGLFCIPFVLWLAATGSIYLFKPQVEAWMDRPYRGLATPGQTVVKPDAQVAAALAAVPGSNLHYYELPREASSAAQIVVGKEYDEFRVYVHPVTAAALKVENEDRRFMKVIFRLHGELLAGDRGSLLVELAASWTIMMILTGLALWQPRDRFRAAGMLYPRFNQSSRGVWRDLHSVTGLWASLFALAFLLTGLPWAKNWGGYFKRVRTVLGASSESLDWTTGRQSELDRRMARNGGEHAAHNAPTPQQRKFGRAARMRAGAGKPEDYDAIDRVLPAAVSLRLAYPVQISPPLAKGQPWTVQSDSQNRMLRDTYTVDAASGAIGGHTGFMDKAALDRAVSIGISAHEGQLFGWLNQLMDLSIAVSLTLLAVSSAVLWLRRRPMGLLGAPTPLPSQPVPGLTMAIIAATAIYLPLLGASLVLILAAEWLVLRRLPGVRTWLGLRPPAI